MKPPSLHESERETRQRGAMFANMRQRDADTIRSYRFMVNILKVLRKDGLTWKEVEERIRQEGMSDIIPGNTPEQRQASLSAAYNAELQEADTIQDITTEIRKKRGLRELLVDEVNARGGSARKLFQSSELRHVLEAHGIISARTTKDQRRRIALAIQTLFENSVARQFSQMNQ